MVARGLIVGSQGPQSKTLLQDIFGDSALAVAPVDPLVQKNVANRPPRNGKEIGDVFAGPAYLIPPLETLFEPLMKHFLTPRPPEDETIPVAARGDEEDMDMDVDESQENSPVGGARAERIVDAKEIEALIELFRHHGVKGKRHRTELRTKRSAHRGLLAAPSPIPQVPLSNGHVPRIHGNAHKKVNGRSHAPSQKANNELHPSSENPGGRSLPESPSSLKVLTSSPALAGKKRKKTTVS